MEQAKRVVDRILGPVLVGLMGIAVINVLWQVFSRYVLGAPISFTQELARFLLIWVGVLGAGYGVGQHDHLALELLPNRLEGQARAWLRIVIQGCILLFAGGVMIAGGLRLVYIQLSLGQTSASLNVPIGYVYSVLPITGILMAFYSLVHIREHFLTLRGEPGAGTESSNPSTDV
jgi:TRAP-type C4-dicarboxylate transport system permease small subunit